MKEYRNASTLLRAVFIGVSFLMLWGCAPSVTKTPELTTSSDDLYAEGDRLFQEQDYDQALAVLIDYVERFPKDRLADAALMKIATIYMAKKDYPSAGRIFTRVITDYPKSPYAADAEAENLATEYYSGNYETVVDSFADLDLTTLSEAQKKKIYMLVGDAHWILGSSAKSAYFYALAYLNAPETDQDAIEVKIREPLSLLSSQELDTLITGTTIPEIRDLLEKLAKQFEYDPSKLGCLLPLSGRYASFGQRALKGVEIALAVYASRQDATDVNIVIKDTGSEPETAARAIRELVIEDRVAGVVGPIITAETAAMAAQEMGVPIITLTQKDRITHIGDYVFRNFFTPQMQVNALVTYCTNELRLNRFAVMYPDEPYGWKFMNLFWDAVIAGQGTLVGVEAYDKTLTDFAGPIRKLAGGYYNIPAAPDPGPPADSGGADDVSEEDRYRKRMAGIRSSAGGPYGLGSGFDALFIPDAPNKTGLIVPQLAYHDVKTSYLLGTNLWHSPKLIEMAEKYVQGAILPVGFFAESLSENVRNFVTAFNETYGEPPEFIEAIAYDSTMILLKATQRPDIPNRHALKNLLLNFGVYHGVTGPTSFDKDGDAIKKLHLLQIKADQFVELDTGVPNLPAAIHQ